MKLAIAFVYVALLIIFFVTSALIVRHTFKYSYLSYRFKKVVVAFGVISFIVILFSLYLMILLLTHSSGAPSSRPTTPATRSTTINF